MLCSLIHSNYAQDRIYNFKHFTTVDGLLDESIRSIEQDAEGFVWLTTSKGLSYFDGKRFTSVLSAKDRQIVLENEKSKVFGIRVVYEGQRKSEITMFH